MNSKVGLVTDSDASLPAALAEQWGILQVPITIHFGDEVFETGIDIDDHHLFQRIDREGKLPTTAAPSPGQFAKAYQEAVSKGSEAILCFCVSSRVSATYKAALSARELVPEIDIHIVDTESLSMGQGFMVIEAAEALAAGATREDALLRALDLRERTHLFAALSTLEYLAMSGRVSHLVAGMAGLLSIKPILSIQEGSLELLERTRTQSRSWRRMVELVQEKLQDRELERMAFVHVNASDELAEFKQLLCRQVDCPTSCIEAELTPGLSVHAGSGVVGVALVTS